MRSPRLASLIGDARFWTDAYFVTAPEDVDAYADLEDVSFRIGEHVLTHSFGGLYEFSLGLARCNEAPVEIAFDDQAHWHPHLFRWEELEAVCAAIAAGDRGLPHPGVPLLLLARFAIVTDEPEAQRAWAVMAAAWDRLGLLSVDARRNIFDRLDARGAGVSWVKDDAGHLHPTQPEHLRGVRPLYSLRRPAPPLGELDAIPEARGPFPFDELDAMLTRARAIAGPPVAVDGAEAPRPLEALTLTLDHQRGVPAELAGLVATVFDRWLREHGGGRATIQGHMSASNGRRLTTSLRVTARRSPLDTLALLRPLAVRLGVGGALGAPTRMRPALSVQLANVTLARWQLGGEDGAQFRATPLSPEQRQAISDFLVAHGAGPPEASGWREVRLPSTVVRVGFIGLEDDPRIDGGCVEADAATPEAADLVVRLARAASLYVLPPVLATGEEQARALGHDWLTVEVVGDGHALLRALGPHVG